MSRRQPRKNGKPPKTEPGAIRFKNNKDTNDEQQYKKPDETA